MDTLSTYLGQQIAFLDEELSAEQLSEYAADGDALLESLERPHSYSTMPSIYNVLRKAASGVSPEMVREIGDSAAWSLDDCLSRRMVAEIPRMVRRALELEPMLSHESGKAEENLYLREATRCYLFGLFNASVALSRSALEQVLSKKIPTLLQGQSKEDRLQTLIKTARKSILRQATHICDLADKVRRGANKHVHESVCKPFEALEVLNDTRRVVLVLWNLP